MSVCVCMSLCIGVDEVHMLFCMCAVSSIMEADASKQMRKCCKCFCCALQENRLLKVKDFIWSLLTLLSDICPLIKTISFRPSQQLTNSNL